MTSVRIHPDVEFALASYHPVVALESAVISSGLPREPRPELESPPAEGWRCGGPVNLELARAMERAIRAAGALPATIAVVDGSLRIGATDAEIATLASSQDSHKAGVTDLACLLAAGRAGQPNAPRLHAGTTVSATLAAARLTMNDGRAGIRVLATGGLGGMHRNWQEQLDISADLNQLASTPACVVCSGVKSILDVPATVEMLEALGVPVIGYRTNHFPQFICASSPPLPLRHRVDDLESAAAVCEHHWWTLGSASAVILANPAPAATLVEESQFNQAMAAAEQAADRADISGPQRTPFLLEKLAQLTGGASLKSNLALLIQNAKTAAGLARALAKRARSIAHTTGKLP